MKNMKVIIHFVVFVFPCSRLLLMVKIVDCGCILKTNNTGSAITFCFSLNCQVVVVPSSRDAHHHPVYPQCPFVWTHKPQVHDAILHTLTFFVVAMLSLFLVCHQNNM